MKPSEIKCLKAKKAHLLPKHFMGITWFGTLYCNNEKDIELINKTDTIDSNFKCHETIHIRQAETMHDSWIRFYLNYIWNYIKNMPLIFTDTYAPYRLIGTEIEAYLHEDEWDYPTKAATEWKELQKLPYREKLQIAREYNRNKRKKTYRQILKEHFLD